ncbi:MAG TPA: HEAT repeat domain-containing protein [Candidatus Methylomirabilis sp.]|nr:HEAT repeat domain-containing protein [Candidatus Methylomirabilis sp.]
MFSIFLLRKLRSQDSVLRRIALEQVKSLEDTRLLDEVIHLLVQDESATVRKEAERAIVRTKPAGAANRLKVLLTSTNPQTRYSVARSLHALGWVPATPQEQAEFAVARGKFELAAREGTVALNPLTLEAKTGVHREAAAASAMAVIGQAAVPRLLTIFWESNHPADVALALAKRGNRVSQIFFREALKDRRTDPTTVCKILAETPMPKMTAASMRVLQGSATGTSA